MSTLKKQVQNKGGRWEAQDTLGSLTSTQVNLNNAHFLSYLTALTYFRPAILEKSTMPSAYLLLSLLNHLIL